jgi:predicted Zn-dependent protease DUF2268
MALETRLPRRRCTALAASWFVILFTVASTPAHSPTQTINNDALRNTLSATSSSVEVVDLTPRFLNFYETAVAEKADPERRWQLWQQLYGFAAVPPRPEGKTMARSLLDHAWPQYPKYIDRIRHGAAVLNPPPQSILESVVKLLGAPQYAIKVKLVVYVGGLENNAFAYVDHGVPTVAIPVESSDKDLQLTMTHEFTHAVHTTTAGLSGGYSQTSVAQLVLMEGLAERVTEKLVPGQTPAIYTSAHSDDWLREAEEHRLAILKGIQQHLDERGPEVMSRFTFGKGTTGLGREAYYAGWVLVGELVRQGMSLAEIAKLPPASMSGLISKVIDSLAAAGGSKKE